MNRFAYRTTSLAIKALESLSNARIRVYGKEFVPKGPKIFVINHFTRVETLILPNHINRITGRPVWSLADYSLFKGGLSVFFDKVGVVSTRNPNRDSLIVKSLLTGEADWIIFPEGRMVKSKKIMQRGKFMIYGPGVKHPPHTGAATLALRTEFYRKRLLRSSLEADKETRRLLELYNIDRLESVSKLSTRLIPVNITYYPIRAKENALLNLAKTIADDLPERMAEEIMTEGTMLIDGVDIDIRFGEPIGVESYLEDSRIVKDIMSDHTIDFDDPIKSRKIMRNISVKIMQRYMGAIYGMTTVNHDHLFASFLKRMPLRKSSARMLKNRAFWFFTKDLDAMGCHFHTSMKMDQLPLLTDDRFNKYQSFLDVAVEKGVVTEKDGNLIKDTSRFSSKFDFHHVRIDNPVLVIANEVEPIGPLQREIRKIARTPAFILKKRIVKTLMDSAVEEFEKDYSEFYAEGESKPRNVGMPFLLKGRSRKLGVLLIHGYMAAPLEIAGLAVYLKRKGLCVYAPRLRGHGTTPEDLAQRTYHDWKKSVEKGFGVISNVCRDVVIGGFSTGAALALDLAAGIPEIKGVFAVCPPLRLQDVKSKFASAVDTWNRMVKRIRMGSAAMEFVDNSPENPRINYFRNPISGVREIELLMEELEPKLPDIMHPSLIAQSFNDPVVNPKGSRKIFEQIGAPDKRYILFNFNRHGILLGKGSEKVHQTIWDFIRGLSKPRN